MSIVLLTGASFTATDLCICRTRNRFDQFFTLSSLVFLSSLNEDYSLVIDYRAIGVHAICHSPEIYKHQCIYCQVSDPNSAYEGSVDFSPGIFLNEDMLVEEEDDFKVEEVFFAPNDSDQSTC